jgi:hypothetical protein
VTVQTRVYVPLTVAVLRRLGTGGQLEPAPFTAYAVTNDLRREHPTADDEELEFLAFTDASTATTGAGPAPVVAAADVDADVVTDLLAPAAAVSAVHVATPVPRRQVASFHVADPGTGRDGPPDYSWYDATELDAVLDLVG